MSIQRNTISYTVYWTNKLNSARKIYAFIKRDMLIDLSYKLVFAFKFFRAFLAVCSVYFLSIIVGDGLERFNEYSDYFSFALLGIAFSELLNTGLNSFTKKMRSFMSEGSLEAMFGTPTQPTQLIIFSCLWQFLFESLNIFLTLFFGIVIFGAQFSNPNYLGMIVILILTIFAFSGLGLISASIILVIKRGDPINWMFTQLSLLLGGTLFPVTILPQPLQALSYLLPITHSLHAIRKALLQGVAFGELTIHILALIAFSIIIFPIGIWMCGLMARKTKMIGDLSTY